MKISFYLGAQNTECNAVTDTLVKNGRVLERAKTVLLMPRYFNDIFQTVRNRLKGNPATPELEEFLLDALLEKVHGDVDRVILFSENFLSAPPGAIAEDRIFPKVGKNVEFLRNLFPRQDVSFHLGIRNPAAFVPHLFARTKETSFDRFLMGTEPTRLRWSETIQTIRTLCADAPLSVWCAEDMPIIWEDVLRDISGIPEGTPMRFILGFINKFLSDEGIENIKSYLESYPPKTIEERHKVMSVFLDKYVKDEDMEETIELPGWNQELINYLSELYEEDIDRIEDIPGVNLIIP